MTPTAHDDDILEKEPRSAFTYGRCFDILDARYVFFVYLHMFYDGKELFALKLNRLLFLNL